MTDFTTSLIEAVGIKFLSQHDHEINQDGGKARCNILSRLNGCSGMLHNNLIYNQTSQTYNSEEDGIEEKGCG